jgi:hypothetical protein
VRRGLLQRHQDRLHYPVEIFDDLIIPEPNDTITKFAKLGGTRGIGFQPFPMLGTVQFDRQFACRTGEVDDTTSDRMLSPKLPLCVHRPQRLPKSLLDHGGIAPQPACDRSPLPQCHRRAPPHPALSALRGGEGYRDPGLANV